MSLVLDPLQSFLGVEFNAKRMILVFGGFLAFFIWPVLYLIAELYLHSVRDSTIKDEIP